MVGYSREKDRPFSAFFSFPWRRRHILATGLSAVAISVTADISSDASSPTAGADSLDFMKISLCLTDRKTLDPVLGKALFCRLIGKTPKRQAKFGQLSSIFNSQPWENANHFVTTAVKQNPDLPPLIRDILHGWYRGIVDEKVVVYRSAMMFSLTRNILYPKTYANGDLFYWTSRPPEVPLPKGQPVMKPDVPESLGK
ncbi:MAG: sorbitol dehydrogenase family protein [Zymomonas mobilis]|uniref:D-sorbitol dehydrogenase (Acceptor) n=1 Tax=Zymomonas mobilis TaxID=542 RepID=A0A542W254_ZYMMB|nr:sorbitol dehydrogenase family protein [Zymomonas mobilis]TQL17643.1 D-sorbitol dehydrogenase (acceptor) [Zymomonas mobilis]